MKNLLTSGIIFLTIHVSYAQPMLAPVNSNPFLKPGKDRNTLLKTTAISIPFFDDFTNEGPFPDAAKWKDRTVYVNNTMGFEVISRGVATFDALNARGGPYDSLNNTALIYADSLTSQEIDLSASVTGDSIYLSFFYQPQGNGFAPETQDSLMLFFKDTSGKWLKQWAVEGTTQQLFRQVMIAIIDPAYFHIGFQFRFVNKATININDDVWNVDYVRLDANRNINDTAVNDVATTVQPPFILNDYSFIPYRQFAADMNAELAAQHYFTVQNNYQLPQNVNYGYTARESITNTPIFSSGITNVSIPAATEQAYFFPTYPVSFSPADNYAKVAFENKYFLAGTGAEPKENDTIICNQVFDNYLAYDDGTAEKSFFIKQFSSLPAKTAIEFHLNTADTLRGVAIYFGRQVPLPFNKFFSLSVYNDIAANGGTDDLIAQQDLYFPGYADTINHFWIYKFDEPVPLQAGTFFLGTIQPASSGSDSLYFGFDVNRTAANHLYINYLDVWEPVNFQGALMVRPLLGKPVQASTVPRQENKFAGWSFYPNPANEKIFIRSEENLSAAMFEITDIAGRTLLKKKLRNNTIDISSLNSGIYFIRISANGVVSEAKKMIKL